MIQRVFGSASVPTFWRWILDTEQVLVDEFGCRGYAFGWHEGRSSCLFDGTASASCGSRAAARLLKAFDRGFEVLEAGLRPRGSGQRRRGGTLLEAGLAMLWHRGLVQADAAAPIGRVERGLELLVLVVHRAGTQTSQASISGSTFLHLRSTTYRTLLLSIFLQRIYVQIVRI